jgi:hypothetical protein
MMDNLSPEAIWSWVLATVVTGVTCFICTSVLVRNIGSGTDERGKEFGEKQKKVLWELLVRTKNKPSNQDIANLLTQKEFAEHHITGKRIRQWFRRTNFLLSKFMYEADVAGEMASLIDGRPIGREGREMAALRARETTSRDEMLSFGRAEMATAADTGGELLPLRGNEFARTADRNEELTTPKEDCACEKSIAIRSGEIVQRWRDS